MKLVLKTIRKGTQTLVDTAKEPDYKERYVNLDGSSLLDEAAPVIEPVIEPAKPAEVAETVEEEAPVKKKRRGSKKRA